MPNWTLRGRAFQRPLDSLEICYLWDGLFNGTADSLHHYEIRLPNDARDEHLFSETNIVKAWVSTKRRYPLAGATVRGADGAPLQLKIPRPTDSTTDIATGFASEPNFVIRGHDLAVRRPDEVVFGSVASAEEAQRRATAVVHGPRLLSEELLVRLYVFRETDPKRTGVLHLMVLMAHCVTDGTGNRTLMRCMLDTLARGGGPEPAQLPLEERLAMVIPPMDLEPSYLRSLSPAVRRWRRAVGALIHQSRTAKTQGGHTLPCRLTRSTAYVAARPGLVSTSFTHAQTATVIANCRIGGITFGNAFLPLAQVAMTRVLYRRYIRGEMSEEEWAYRKRQPHINGGPLSLRSYLDEPWFEKGGGGEFMLCISLFVYQLPFMTLSEAAERLPGDLADGTPPFSDFLTFDRFLHRARSVKKQATAFFSHPLFLEIVHASHLAYIHYTRHRALRWMQHTDAANDHDIHEDEDSVLVVTDIPTIWAHGGSSLGNLDLISPAEYPLPPSHPLSPYSTDPHPAKAGYVIHPSSTLSDPGADATPKIIVENSRTYLHTRPAELYLGAATSRGQMNLYVQYDGNVFEDRVVREWLDEVRDAVLWYLGRS